MMSGTKFKDAQCCGISATQRCSSPVLEAAIWSESEFAAMRGRADGLCRQAMLLAEALLWNCQNCRGQSALAPSFNRCDYQNCHCNNAH
jgi:hypothetical protein